MWQDTAFAAGGLVFTACLIPILRDPKAGVPRITSVLTVVFLALYSVAYWSMGMVAAAIMESLATLTWAAIAVWRPVQPDAAPRAKKIGWDRLEAYIGKVNEVAEHMGCTWLEVHREIADLAGGKLSARQSRIATALGLTNELQDMLDTPEPIVKEPYNRNDPAS